MEVPQSTENADFGGPATYRIIVQGTLSAEWSDRFAGMTITSHHTEGGQARSNLTGTVQDHAELFGVLDALYDLHLPLLHLDLIDNADDATTPVRKEIR
jgi:hypothetical protein